LLDRFFLSVGEDLGGSVLSLDWELLIRAGMQWFNVALLAVIMTKLLYKPVKNFLADRAERIKNDIDSARANNAQASEIKANYQKMIDNIEKEKEEILIKARQDANKEHERIVLEAQKEAKHLIVKANDEIKVERENAAREIKTQIIEISTLIASRFIEISVDRQTQDKFVDEALADWSEQV